GGRQLMSEPTGRNERCRSTRLPNARGPLGTIAALVAVMGLLTGCGVSLQSMPKPGADRDNTYLVHATFSYVLNLPANAEIRDGSRDIGVVGDMRGEDYRATVDLRIKEAYEIPPRSTPGQRVDNPPGDPTGR